jgi:hypothetical protein
MGGVDACRAYIDKLEYFGNNYSPGKIFISPSSGGYGNTNFYFDDGRFSFPYGTNLSYAHSAKDGVLLYSPTASVIYTNFADDGIINGHLTNNFNVAGYLTWGGYTRLGADYATNGMLHWSGDSSWWIIATVESYNGTWYTSQGNFRQWFSSNAFGGLNYSNTPIGAVSHVREPYGLGNDSSSYFGIWASGECFGYAAWKSRITPFFQAIGDPLVVK